MRVEDKDVRTFRRAADSWLAVVSISAIPFVPGKVIRPYSYTGVGASEAEAVAQLKALEAADNWKEEG